MKNLKYEKRCDPLLLIAFFLVFLLAISVSTQSNIQLTHYEELEYNDFDLKVFSSRKKRDANQVENFLLDTNRLSFYAYKRLFNITLKRDTSLVADNLDVEVRYSYPNKPTKIEHVENFFASNYYVGYVENESRSSSVICYFEKKNSSTNQTENEPLLVYIQIRIQKEDQNDEIFYVEPSPLNNESNKFKYIIYKSDAVRSDVISNNIFNTTVCKPKYVNESLNDLEDQLLADKIKKNVAKRQIKQEVDKNQRKNRCFLALVADHRFFKSVGNSNVKQTTAYLVNVIGAINNIFTRTEWRFDDDIDPELRRNFGFSVEKVIVHATPTTDQLEHYNNANSSTVADKVLELFGQEDFTSFCLAHLFTYQTFENSVLGLAYVSSPLLYTLGGICSNPSTRRKSYSVNTGLSSYKSVSQTQGRLLQREAELVTAHEFGHNWGSEHDPSKAECSPRSGSNGGNYIMYAYSNQGHERNNYLFSPCSINSISEVIKKKSICFKGESMSYCGNERIEPGEQCDAGLGSRQGTDKCCDSNCKLKPGAQCSDVNHNCCTKCQIASKNSKKCYSSPNYLECFEEFSYCNGLSQDCPAPNPKKANSDCYSFDWGKCDSSGHCLSICQQRDKNYLPCLCTNKEEKCMICCRTKIDNQTTECLPYHKLFSDETFFLSNGRACIDGLCENGQCKHKVKDYVTRFWKVIQTVTVSGFLEFMKRNIVGSIILISLSFWVPISCCIHFCIDKRNHAEQKNLNIQKYQELKRFNINRNINVENSFPNGSNQELRERNIDNESRLITQI